MLSIASLLSVMTSVPMFIGYISIISAPVLVLLAGATLVLYAIAKTVFKISTTKERRV
jgi:hypothetical protein